MPNGSTCYALSVERDDGQRGVLKVAKDPSLNNRLQDEADALQELHHPNIVRLLDQEEIDGCIALFVEQAGDQTLGQRLRHGGALSLDLLDLYPKACPPSAPCGWAPTACWVRPG